MKRIFSFLVTLFIVTVTTPSCGGKDVVVPNSSNVANGTLYDVPPALMTIDIDGVTKTFTPLVIKVKGVNSNIEQRNGTAYFRYVPLIPTKWDGNGKPIERTYDPAYTGGCLATYVIFIPTIVGYVTAANGTQQQIVKYAYYLVEKKCFWAYEPNAAAYDKCYEDWSTNVKPGYLPLDTQGIEITVNKDDMSDIRYFVKP